MRPLLLFSDTYVEDVAKIFFITGLVVGGIVVLIVWDTKVMAARPPTPTPVPPASLPKRLTWFEWLLVVAAVFAAFSSLQG